MSRLLVSQRASVLPGWTKEELSRKARAVPGLDLRFSDTKSLTDATTGQNLVSFARASSGTYVGSDGVIRTAATDEPRFDHNPTTGESLGLLVEEQRTNLLTYSELFNASPWGPGSLLVAPATETTSPAGNSTAVRLIENTVAAQFHFINYFLTKAASAIQYTVCVYAKDRGRELIFSAYNGATGVVARFNLATGVITAPATSYGGGFTSQGSTITPVGNGWYRCSMTFTTDTATGLAIQFALYNTTLATNVYTGDGASGVFLWGAQLEVGAFPTSYIPTTTAAATRAADVAQITGTNFSSWYRQDEGTVFASAQRQIAGVVAGVLTGFAQPSTFGNSMYMSNDTGSPGSMSAFVRSGGAQQANVSANVTVTSPFRQSFAYQLDNFAGSINGSSLATDTSGTVAASVGVMAIGSAPWSTGANPWNGHIRRLTYWPQRLSNSTLQAITQ